MEALLCFHTRGSDTGWAATGPRSQKPPWWRRGNAIHLPGTPKRMDGGDARSWHAKASLFLSCGRWVTHDRDVC